MRSSRGAARRRCRRFAFALTLPDPNLSTDFDRHRKVLWDLSYRMTGSAADADDVVQETFVRALARPPARTDIPLLPWLVRVALNASRDLLRRRRRREYIGPWLPEPIELAAADGKSRALTESAEARYDLLESASFAFLLALEVLSARQRAVLLLRDVFDYSVRETAAALEVSEGAVKTAHHRARRCMQDYDRGRTVQPAAERTAQAERALTELMNAVIAQDVAKVEALLAADARLLTDGGGEYLAARKPIQGAKKIARGLVALARVGSGISAEVRAINGTPAVVLHDREAPPRYAPRLVLGVEPAASGRIDCIYVVLATSKLGAVRFP
jgi:RNA polymerase sigma-70 factor, ECF subfamily